ncbi:hypothetical protein VNO78_01854 [Psophocarpus tetragonolobus]|uniref:Uncharacterized protein n=1 Tax=Psophocarpus tetragonolobus TaxID=3891 RepID=A0AAN9XUH1_PSOTE
MEEITVNGKGQRKEENPTRTIVCQRKEDMRLFEETEDCFILNFDPFDSLDFSELSLDSKEDNAADVYIVAVKGQVACRDYPHPRYLCIKFPFTTTPHESYCDKCYCCVCDIAAPCKHWTQFMFLHCDVADGDEYRET